MPIQFKFYYYSKNILHTAMFGKIGHAFVMHTFRYIHLLPETNDEVKLRSIPEIEIYCNLNQNGHYKKNAFQGAKQ